MQPRRNSLLSGKKDTHRTREWRKLGLRWTSFEFIIVSITLFSPAPTGPRGDGFCFALQFLNKVGIKVQVMKLTIECQLLKSRPFMPELVKLKIYRVHYT